MINTPEGGQRCRSDISIVEYEQIHGSINFQYYTFETNSIKKIEVLAYLLYHCLYYYEV